MVEFFKILIEEPEKLRKLGIFLVKIILNLIFAAKLYALMFGDYSIINLKDISAWIEFVMSGRVLICFVFYLLSDSLLFGFLELLTLGVLDYFARKNIKFLHFGRDEKNLLNKALCYFELIEIDKETKKVAAGKNIDGFHEFIEFFTLKESKEELTSLKNSLVKDLVHIYFVFLLVYYGALHIKPHSQIFNWILLLGGITLPFLYIIASKVLNFLRENSESILFEIQRLRIEKNLHKILAELGLLNYDFTSMDPVKFREVILYKNKNYHFKINYNRHLVREYEIESIKKDFIDKNEKFVLITNMDLEVKAQEMVDEYKNSFLVARYTSESDLKECLIQFFKDK